MRLMPQSTESQLDNEIDCPIVVKFILVGWYTIRLPENRIISRSEMK